MSQHELTIARILQDLALEIDGEVRERDLYDRVLARRPSQAKDPYASIREKLRWDGGGVGWVRLGDGMAIPLRLVRDGLRIRVTPDDQEYHQDMLMRLTLYPYIGVHDTAIALQDAEGRPLRPARGEASLALSAPISLGDWYRRSGFQQGDSVLITFAEQGALTLRLEREPAAELRIDDLLRAERELLDAIAAHLARSRSTIEPAEHVVLPIVARADWRTGYPCRPWQQLVTSDRRVRLVDGYFLAGAGYRRPLDLLIGEDDELARDSEDAELLDQIHAFQAELLASRRTDAAQGVWDGRSQRASTARMIFDSQAGTTTVVYLDPVNTLEDHAAEIDRNLLSGGYDPSSWGELADDLDLDDDDDDFDDGLFGESGEIEDLQTFMAENPALAEAAQKLMAALTPDELERLQNADSAEEAQQILAGRFQRMLHKDPSLFATLAPYTADHPSQPTEHQNGGSSGHHDGLNGTMRIEELSEIAPWELYGAADGDGDGDDDDDGELGWGALSAEHMLGGSAASREALERSEELSERFYEHLRAQGKSEATAHSRASDLVVYADFLANYYHRTLAEGDYATLDECLFFYYPRRVMSSSPRLAREMCTSIKQFYAFMRDQRLASDAFAQAIWRRRDQAARVVELYEHIDSDSPQFERLFAHLFAPYTV